jgi:5-methylcytosine-specific restriction endonuclease McrA
MPQSFCTVCRVRIPKGSRCARHAIRSPSNRTWHRPGAARIKANLLAQGCCAICGSTEGLEVHHVIPARDGGPTTTENLVVLCHDHHIEAERSRAVSGSSTSKNRPGA